MVLGAAGLVWFVLRERRQPGGEGAVESNGR